jgi:hypothetical protein
MKIVFDNVIIDAQIVWIIDVLAWGNLIAHILVPSVVECIMLTRKQNNVYISNMQ